MRVYDLLIKACEALSLVDDQEFLEMRKSQVEDTNRFDNSYSPYFMNENGVALMIEQTKQNVAVAKCLVDAFNNVFSHICIKCELLKCKQNFFVTNSEFNLLQLQKPLFKIKYIKKDGVKVKFNIMGTTLLLENGEYEICYLYHPTALNIDDQLDDVLNFLPKHLLVYGICSEFCLFENRLDEAKEWNNKYIQIINQINRNLQGTVIKSRRWLLWDTMQNKLKFA